MDETPSTPKSQKSPANIGSFSTPYSQTSHRSHDSHPRSQQDLQVAMKEELHHGIFQSKSWLDHRCPVDTGVVDRVIADLKISHDNLRYLDDSPAIEWKSWPEPNAPEREHYQPFACLLNEILRSSRTHVKSGSFHENLTFFSYDRPVLEGVDKDWPLKPDIVGCHRKKLPRTDKVSWKDILIPVEVKGRWPEMVSQASTYARCCLIFQKNRDMLPAIHFNHVRKEVRLGCYTHEGLDASEVFEIATINGFRNLVHAIVGIYSWNDATSAGFDVSRTETHFVIPNDKIYAIREVLCDRKCVRGRGTRVYSIEEDEEQTRPGSKAVDPPTPQAAPHNHYHLRSLQHRLASPIEAPIEAIIPVVKHMSLQPGGSEQSKSAVSPPIKPTSDKRIFTKGDASPTTTSASDRVTRNSKVKRAHATLDPLFHEWDVDIARAEAGFAPFPTCNIALWCLMPGVDLKSITVPKSVILKDSWPLESHCEEGAMFQRLRDQFGLPTVLFAYAVTTGASHIPHDASYWDVFGTGDGQDVRPERRIHMRIILATKGISLLASPGPKGLVEGVVHAMLGHYNMFKEGWLHRDVSIGNVMLMTAESRIPVGDFDVTKKITTCVGFISDGDQAILWKNSERSSATRRSGTLPFISIRLIEAWNAGEQAHHTAVDDLESFIWVLLWSVLLTLNAKEMLADNERKRYLAPLFSENLPGLRARAGFLRTLRDKTASHELSIGLKPFSALLIRWLKISEHAASNIPPSSAGNNGLQTYCRSVYEKYIKEGLELMQKLPESWDYLRKETAD